MKKSNLISILTILFALSFLNIKAQSSPYVYNVDIINDSIGSFDVYIPPTYAIAHPVWIAEDTMKLTLDTDTTKINGVLVLKGTSSQYVKANGDFALFPTNLSQFTNDPGFITSYTETDPNVPSYAKTLSAFSVIKASTDPLYRPITYVPDFVDVGNKPTTVAGYNITDAYTKTQSDSRYLQAEVDGSVTNEIELPSQSGNSGKILSTNGSSVSWISPASSPGTNNTAAYGTGTVYSLTTTSEKVDFGTTDPSITLPEAGTYLIMANVKIEYSGLLTALNTCSFKLRRTNNTAADIPSATTNFNVPAITLISLSGTGGDADLAPVIYTTTNNNDVIEVWGNRANGISITGQINVGEASIIAVRIY